MKSFSEALTEGLVTFEGMNYRINVVFDREGMALQFIPDSKTLDLPRNVQVEAILKRLKERFPFTEAAKNIWYKSGSSMAGLVFYVNTGDIRDEITNALK